MWPKPMCLRMTAPFLVSTRPLSPDWPGAVFGLFDQRLVEQLRYGLVDELAAVVGVESADAEGELAQHRFEHGQEASLTDGWSCGHDLPLRHLIDGVDMVDALGSGSASRAFALMHRI